MFYINKKLFINHEKKEQKQKNIFHINFIKQC